MHLGLIDSSLSGLHLLNVIWKVYRYHLIFRHNMVLKELRRREPRFSVGKPKTNDLLMKEKTKEVILKQ